MKTNIRMKLLSPLMHFGDERLGTMQAARTMKYEYKGEYIDVPVSFISSILSISKGLPQHLQTVSFSSKINCSSSTL